MNWLLSHLDAFLTQMWNRNWSDWTGVSLYLQQELFLLPSNSLFFPLDLFWNILANHLPSGNLFVPVRPCEKESGRSLFEARDPPSYHPFEQSENENLLLTSTYPILICRNYKWKKISLQILFLKFFTNSIAK